MHLETDGRERQEHAKSSAKSCRRHPSPNASTSTRAHHSRLCFPPTRSQPRHTAASIGRIKYILCHLGWVSAILFLCFCLSARLRTFAKLSRLSLALSPSPAVLLLLCVVYMPRSGSVMQDGRWELVVFPRSERLSGLRDGEGHQTPRRDYRNWPSVLPDPHTRSDSRSQVVGVRRAARQLAVRGRTAGCQSVRAIARPSRSHSQGVFERVVHLEDRSLVTTSVAVVRCGENGDDIAFLRPAARLAVSTIAIIPPTRNPP